MSYKNWNEYFYNFHDDKKAASGSIDLMKDLDDLDREYKTRYGMYIDHHAFKLAKECGHEKAWYIVNRNLKTMSVEKFQALEREKLQYEFHAVPDDEVVPF